MKSSKKGRRKLQKSDWKMKLPVEVSLFLLSLLAPGIFYTINNIPVLQQPLVILGVVLVVVGWALLIVPLLVLNHKAVDPLYYAFGEFCFTCSVALTNALEQDGFISGFMDFYLKKGEPHLVTAYALMMSYWEGVVHFILLLTIIHRMFRGKPYRSLSLLLVGSSIAQQIVLIPGVLVGKYGSNIKPAFWRNIPFFLVPFWAASVLLSRPRVMPVIPADKILLEQSKGLLTRPADLVLSLLMLGAAAFTVFRAFVRLPLSIRIWRLLQVTPTLLQVVLECPLAACFTYAYDYEPYLKDPVGFPRVMMLVYFFYALPLLAALIYGLRTPGCSWMLDSTLLFAGAMAQTSWCHIGASLHSKTAYTYRVPSQNWWAVVAPNLIMAALPALLALRCHFLPAYFMKKVPIDNNRIEKKMN